MIEITDELRTLMLESLQKINEKLDHILEVVQETNNATKEG